MKINEKIENYILNKSNKLKINSNDISKGDVFLALKGKNCHGNKYINHSLKKGAKYCITNKKIQNKKNLDKIYYVRDINFFLKSLAIKKRNCFKGKVIGITGSAGKTTLKTTLSFFMKKKYNVSFSHKSYNNFLGVILSILNMDSKSNFAIFELGTNNFGEISSLVQYVKPSITMITNIQPTHLENFKTKKNVAIEKSDIFNPKYNSNINSVILSNDTKEEKNLVKIAKKYKVKNVIKVGDTKNNNSYINKITKRKNDYLYELIINKKKYLIKTKIFEKHRIKNLLFCMTLFDKYKISKKILLNNIEKLKPVEGRGSLIKKKLGKIKIHFIDETYNANPITMKQSIVYLNSIKFKNYNKVLILGNMNELGKASVKYHFEIIKFLENYKFDLVILCGKLLELAICKIKKPKNNFIILRNEDDLLKYLKKHLYNNAILLAKCSNNTIVNKFGRKFLN